MIYGESTYDSCSTCRFWKRTPSEDDKNGDEFGICEELPSSDMMIINIEGSWVKEIKTEASFSCSLHE